jgi:hypothetical protein
MPRKPPLFFDRKVQPHGYTRLISLGKIIPADWRYVRIYCIKQTDTEVHLIIRKLLGVEANACPPRTHKESGENPQGTR